PNQLRSVVLGSSKVGVVDKCLPPVLVIWEQHPKLGAVVFDCRELSDDVLSAYLDRAVRRWCNDRACAERVRQSLPEAEFAAILAANDLCGVTSNAVINVPSGRGAHPHGNRVERPEDLAEFCGDPPAQFWFVWQREVEVCAWPR